MFLKLNLKKTLPFFLFSIVRCKIYGNSGKWRPVNPMRFGLVCQSFYVVLTKQIVDPTLGKAIRGSQKSAGCIYTPAPSVNFALLASE